MRSLAPTTFLLQLSLVAQPEARPTGYSIVQEGETRQHSQGPNYAPQAAATVRLDKAVYRKNEIARARVSGTVMLDGSCNSRPLVSILSNGPITGLIVDPCAVKQMGCGLGSAEWKEQPLEFDLSHGDPGPYRLVVCGVGQVEFTIVE